MNIRAGGATVPPMRPIPLQMRLHALSGSLHVECSLCRRTTSRTADELLALFPPDMLVMLIVERFYCRFCSGERRVRPMGRVG